HELRDPWESRSVLHIVEPFRQRAGELTHVSAEHRNQPHVEQDPEDLVEVILRRGRGVRSTQPRVLAQDLAVELLEIAPRLDSELVHQPPPRVLVDVECLSLASRAIEGENQMGTQTLSGGMAVDQ